MNRLFSAADEGNLEFFVRSGHTTNNIANNQGNTIAWVGNTGFVWTSRAIRDFRMGDLYVVAVGNNGPYFGFSLRCLAIE